MRVLTGEDMDEKFSHLTAEDRARLGGYVTTVFKKDEAGEEGFLAELTRQVREVSEGG